MQHAVHTYKDPCRSSAAIHALSRQWLGESRVEPPRTHRVFRQEPLSYPISEHSSEQHVSAYSAPLY
jgi:hypothetical protein